MALTMDDVISSVFELTFGEKSLTSNTVKFALQVAACSAQQPLSGNGRIARVLARYVERELPDRETLYRILATDAKAMINTNHITAIYHAEALQQSGDLDKLITCGLDLASQLQWRRDVYDLYHMNKKGYGLGWKTISFAHMLLFPTTSDLVPIDRHHMNRLYGTTTSPSSEKKYLQVEDVIRQEQLASNYANYPASWFAWLKWEQFRQATGASLSTNGCESHLLLSVYWY